MSNVSNNESKVFAMECIETALFDLMKEKPFQSISFSEISARAGTSRNAIYRNFSSKDDILEQYFNTRTKKFLQGTENLKSYKEYLLAVFTYLDSIKSEAGLVFRAGRISILFRLFMMFKNRFDFEKDAVREYYEYYRTGGVFCVYLHWLSSGCVEPPEVLCDMVFKIVKEPGIIPELEK